MNNLDNALTQVFNCPVCHQNYSKFKLNMESCICLKCGFKVSIMNGIPIMVKDLGKIETIMEEAKNSQRAGWYQEPQSIQWVGSYRHHFKKRLKYVEDILKKYTIEVGNLDKGLDLGCGDGSNISWLSKYFSQLYASDYNMERLLRAKKDNNQTLIFMADVTDYPVSDNAFDVIYFNHVLEHISDDEKALSEIYRILKPGGILILGVPNEGAAFWQFAYKLQPKVLERSDHVQFYTIESLTKKCEKAGFLIKDIHPIGWGVPNWTIDEQIRKFKWVDDLLECIGKRLFPSQATSIYLVVTK